MTLEIKSGKEVDPFDDGKFPLCYVGNDMEDGLDYWIVGYTEKMSVREQANYIIGMQTEIASLKKQLAEEKARTNMLNFNQDCEKSDPDISKALNEFYGKWK